MTANIFVESLWPVIPSDSFRMPSPITGLLDLSSVTHIRGSNKKLESLFLSMKLHIRYLRSMEDSESTRRGVRELCSRAIVRLLSVSPGSCGRVKTSDFRAWWPIRRATFALEIQLDREEFWLALGWQAYHELPKVKASLIIAWEKRYFRCKTVVVFLQRTTVVRCILVSKHLV